MSKRSKQGGYAPVKPSADEPKTSAKPSTSAKPATKAKPQVQAGDAPKPADTAQAQPNKSEPSRDVMLVRGPTPDGKGYAVLRAKDDTLSAGVVAPLQEGKPIAGEVVRLRPREASESTPPGVYDVETLVKAPTSAQASGPKAGPAQVNSDAYRKNWDRIWSRKSAKNVLN